MRAFFGFLRRGSDGRTWRLYLTVDLDDYIEIDDSQILHSVAYEGSQYPLGGALVWVRRTAKLKRVAARSTEAQADFLRGEIAAGYLRGAMATLLTNNRPPVGTGYGCTEQSVCAPCLTWGGSCYQESNLNDPAPRPYRE